MDILSSSINDNRITWYENDGNEIFTERNIDNGTASGVRSIEVADLDGDGDVDVLASLFSSNEFVWYRNDGTSVFAKQTIGTASGAHSAFPADLDGDGDMTC